MAQLFAGTSGFAYPSWKPRFYPEKLPAKKFLQHYSQRLNAVEINYTFRRLAALSTLTGWVEASGPGFVFAPKANMRITHIQKLKDAGPATELFLKTIDPLRSARRLGPILFQLPPTLRFDMSLLSEFLGQLPNDLRYTFEFRHASWLNDETYRLLADRNVALCAAESEKLETPEVVTSDFIYYRLRKPEYSLEDRREIAAGARKMLADGKDVFVFFKHEDTPEGALYAEEILKGLP
ncbi:MAG TPA: DUF72 domain-containing protein [Bryobacteraceae bacterium]|jgi:uncharacterized protein YecE (DUF72 family)|nr:DUF72 domain-containing protein [Bryobacteraceae bacterium]